MNNASDPHSAAPLPTQRESIGTRVLLTIIFVFLFALAETVIWVLALVQLVWIMLYKEPNAAIRDFGLSLSDWVSEVVRYQTAVTDDRPFPWGKWPEV